MADDAEHPVLCLGTRLPSKTRNEDDVEHQTSCFSPFSLNRSDSKKSLTTREDYESSKTPWPVPSIEGLFLPHFKVDYGRANKYSPLREVTRGSFGGRVFEVLEESTGRRFALKVLSKYEIIKSNAIRQAKDEAEIGRMVGHHMFIIDAPVYWQNRRNLYLATPWASGGDLYGLAYNYGPLPEELVRIYVAQVSIALEFLHSAGIIYRDLKAENILLDGTDLSVRLSDFGLAKKLKRGNRTRTICGSRVYSAPEIGGSEGYGHAVDWWSLGVLVYVLLNGRLPELDSEVKFKSLSDLVHKDIQCNTSHVSSESYSSKLNTNTAEDENANKRNQTSGNKNCNKENVNTFRDSLAFDLSDEKLSSASRDLIRRLTNFDPSLRPSSGLALSRLAFFVGFDLMRPEAANRVAPRLLVDRLVPRKPQVVEMISSDVVFFETEDELFPVLV